MNLTKDQIFKLQIAAEKIIIDNPSSRVAADEVIEMVLNSIKTKKFPEGDALKPWLKFGVNTK